MAKKTQATEWFVRPYGGSYGSANGSDYSNAWDGLENITWNNIGIGDMLHICGTHVREVTSGGNIAEQGDVVPFVSGTIESPVVITGECSGDSGIIWGAYKDSRPDGMTVAGWQEIEIGVFYNETNLWNKAFTSMGLFEDISGTSYEKYTKLNSPAEVSASLDGGVYYIEEFGTNQMRIWLRPFNAVTFKNNIRWSGVAGWQINISPDHAFVEIRDLKFYASFVDYAVHDAGAGPYHNYTFKNLVIYPFHQLYAFTPWNSHDITIDGCEFAYSGNGFYTIWSYGTNEHITIKNSYFHDIGKQNMYGGGADGHGIGVQNNQYYTILNNRFERMGSAIDFHVGATDTQRHIFIERNFAHDLRVAYGDVAQGNGFAFEGDNDNTKDNTSDMHFTNNIVSDCEGTGIATTRKPNVDIFNNTIYGCNNGYVVMGNRIDGASATFYNNISLSAGDNLFYFNQNATDINFDFLGDYNLYYPNAEQSGAFYYLNTHSGAISNTNATFTQWQAGHASYGDIVDTHSLLIDPMFKNASGNFSVPSDFELATNSPAINAGTDVGLIEDFAGNPIVGTPDIGAYEFQGDIISPNSPTGLSVL